MTSYLVKTLTGRTLEIEASSFNLEEGIYLFRDNGEVVAQVPGMGILAVVKTQSAKADGWDEKIVQNLFESDQFFDQVTSLIDFWHDQDFDELGEEKKETIQ